MKPILKGNIAMAVSKIFSGLNENALRFLLPHWMSPWSGVLLRLGFGAVAFWIIGCFRKKQTTPTSFSEKAKLFLLGLTLIFGFMAFLLLGLALTTPIASSMFICTQPVWVFILSMLFFSEKATTRKVIGIALGLGGALLCILTQKQSDIASNPLLGDIFCAASAILYALYLVVSQKMMKHIDNVTVSKWSFLGGAVAAVAVVCFAGWYAPVLTHGFFSTPFLVLVYVLIFPTTISYFLLYIGLRNLSATVVAIYGYLILIVAGVASFILGQDRFDWFQLIAALMIVASVYFVEIAEQKSRVNASSPNTSDTKHP